MTTQTIILIGLGLYFSLLLLIGFFSTKNQTHEGFVIGNRNVGLIPTIGSLAAGFRDGGGIVIWVGLGFTIGYSGFWIVAGLFCGLGILSYFGPKVRELAIKKNYITVGQMLTDVIGSKTSKSISSIILLLSALIISIQLYVSGNLISNILGYPPCVGIIVVAIVIAFYLYAGGYSSVVKTDFIQFFVMLSFIAIPFFLPPAKTDIMNVKQLFAFGENDLAFFGIGFFLILAGADVWQRIFSAKSKRVIRLGFPLVAPFLLALTLSLIFLGMGMKPYLGNLEAGEVFFSIFSSQISPYILMYIAVVSIAITMSTLDTYTYLFSSTILEDFSKLNIQKDREKYIRLSRWIMSGVLALMSLTAIYISDFIQFAFGAYAVAYSFAPIFVFAGMGWFKKSKRLDNILTILLWSSLTLWGILALFGLYEKYIYTLIPAVFMTISVVIANKFIKRSKNKK